MAEGGAAAAAAASPASGEKKRFALPTVVENVSGWGPTTLPDQFKDIPFQPFSKSDRVGKAADAFTGMSFQTRRNRYGSQYSTGQDNVYGYYHDDESAFQLVDTMKVQRQVFRNKKWQSRVNRRDVNRARDDRRMAGMQTLARGQKGRERERDRKWQRKAPGGRRDRMPMKQREPSVSVKATWKVIEDIEFAKLTKLAADVDEPKDLLLCGAVEPYDRQFDRISTKQPKPLQPTRRKFYHVTTTDDPHIRKFASTGEGNVFATDSLLAALMTAPRSLYSWDIVLERIKDKLFIDKRDDDSSFNPIDQLTVSETANEPPEEDADHINSPISLSKEATHVNETFSQQCLRHEAHRLPAPHPFVKAGEEPASVAYRYRKWVLGENLVLVARTELDAELEKGEFITVRAVNEWDPKATGNMDWRQKLDTQRGAVFATELKNNNCKLAKWTVSALLAGSSSLRLGYVSRAHPLDPTSHVILGTHSHKPKEFAAQISLSLSNGWGIVKHLCELGLKLPEGKYVVLRDPVKPQLRIYSVPEDTFDEEDEEEDAADHSLVD